VGAPQPKKFPILATAEGEEVREYQQPSERRGERRETWKSHKGRETLNNIRKGTSVGVS